MTKRIAFVPVTLGAVIAVLVIAAGSAYLPTDPLSVSRMVTEDSVIDAVSIDPASPAPIAADHDAPLTAAVPPPPSAVKLQALLDTEATRPDAAALEAKIAGLDDTLQALNQSLQAQGIELPDQTTPPPAPSAMTARLQAVRAHIRQTQQSNRI